MANPRKKDSQRFRIYTSQRSGFEFGFQPITERPNAYWRETGKPVQDINIQVSPNEFDSPPPSNKPLGGQGDISGNVRANSDFTSANAEIDAVSNVYLVSGGGIDINTVLMLHMDGTNGSTVFTDSELTPKTVTTNGGAQISTSNFQFSPSSGLFTKATHDFLSLADSGDWNFGSGDWTIDFWVNFNSTGTSQYFVSQFDSATETIRFNLNSSSQFAVSFQDITGGHSLSTNTLATFTTGQWYHVAYVRNGNFVRIYVNGVNQQLSGTGNITGFTFPNLSGKLKIGCTGLDASETLFLDAYLDELRISKGIARWTSDFIVPSVPYTSTTTTIPLPTVSPMLISSSSSTVTLNSNPVISPGMQSQQITLLSVGSQITFNNGNGLSLNTNSFVMTSGALLNLMYQSGTLSWQETSRSFLYGDLGQY